MRHQVAGYKLNRTKSARIALRRNLIKQLFLHERIRTTSAKAAAIRNEAEKMITIARNANKAANDAQKVAARRLVASRLGNNSNEVVKKLFDEIAPRMAERPGGYTRVLKLGPRYGDKAEMVLLELVEE
ncbi:MAG: 50S ribosomal protein L17 [Anaerolineales bacterium]|nr:50S ribosomal protein L17 [Anaerolineales bacterium]MCX7608863.1 50S ribosomal protein L17 [Anaerolineales bacterium]MDW8226296.1 50S ribosomal protein L17 [Anaerolineales bacterium]